jgi:ribosomal-protein-alanine N-acetyltransferase
MIKKTLKITTRRLVLSPLKSSDAVDIYAFAKLPGLGEGAGWHAHHSVRETLRFIAQAKANRAFHEPPPLAVRLQGSPTVIGMIELHTFVNVFKAQLGMSLHPDYHNQGLMYEASMALLVYGFETLKLKRISYHCFPDNLPSQSLSKKLPLRYEGLSRNGYRMPDGTLKDTDISAITFEDYVFEHALVFEQFKRHYTLQS